MTLPLELGQIADDYARRALDRIAQRFPLAASTDNFQQVPQARVYHNAAQSLTTAVLTTLAFNSERYDLGATTGMHDTVTNNTRLTCQVAGLYSISATVEFLANTAGYRQVAFRVNGATFIATITVPANPAGAETTQVPMSTDYRLAVGDYVECLARQTSGAGLNVTSSSNFSPEFMAHWVSP